ncbi:MAG: chitobiase/beta-hexosaminidase C-terminal domain-containing protein [Verrucomicrobiota bacterium]|jgi:hypothetical protein
MFSAQICLAQSLNSYSRIVTADLPGTPLVTVLVTTASNISCFTVEERLPGPLQAVNITGGGAWNPDTGTVRWGPFTKAPVFSATYRVTGPPGAYPVDGSESVDGQWTFDPGPTLVTIAAPSLAVAAPPAAPPQAASPVFTPPSGTPIPVVVTLANVNPSAVTYFTLDGTLPDTNSTLYTGSLTITNYAVIRAQSFVSGQFPSAAVSAYYYNSLVSVPPTNIYSRVVTNDLSGTPVVAVVITNALNIFCFTVEEHLPGPLQAVNISGGGVWNSDTSTVRWGPFTNTSIFSATYCVTGPPGTYPVDGSESVDGQWTIDLGPTLVTIVPPPLAVAAPPEAPSQTAMPIFTPPSGTPPPVMVTMVNLDPSAITYFTLDGTVPDTNSTRYTGPLTITNYTVVRARSFVTGQSPSAAATAYYYNSLVSVPPTNSCASIVTADLPETPLVTVVITNALNIFCFTVEERLPGPLQAVNITGGGVWNPDTGTVRWGPLTNTPVFSATYRVTGPPGAYPVDGSESVDGQWTFDLGPTLVTIAAPLAAVPAAPSEVAMPEFALGASLTNGSFENPNLGPGNYLYFSSMTSDQQSELGWMGVGGVALFANNSAWNYANVPDGGQGISLQSEAAISQVVNFPAAGTYTLTWMAASRSGQLNPAVVQVDGVTVYHWQTTSTAWTTFSTALNITNPGYHTITFAGLGNGGADVSVGVDSVSLIAISTWPVDVTISCATPGAAIYYTLDGSMPTALSPIYTGFLHFDSAVEVRARGFVDGWTPSAVSVAYYAPTLPPPDLQVACTVDTNAPAGPWVSVTASPGANAHCFAVEEWLPAGLCASNITAGGVFIASNAVVRWGPFFTTNTQTLAYQAVGLAGTYPVRTTWSVDGISSSETQATTVVLTPIPIIVPTSPSQEPPPVLSPAIGGALPITVTISCSDAQAELHYTIDGSAPTLASPLYTTPLEFTRPTGLRARAFYSGSTPSAEAVAYYGLSVPPPDFQVSRTIDLNSPLTPVVNLTVIPGPGLSGVVCYAVEEALPAGVVAVNISAGGVFIASNAVVRWGPFFGTTPLELSYQAIGLSGTYPLRATWSVNGVSNGELVGTDLVIGANPIGPIPTAPSQELAPVLSPVGGTTLPINVAISCSDPRAQIRYTLDGSSPTSGSPLYTSALTLASPTTLRARSFSPGWLPSADAVGYYIALANTNSPALVRSVSADASSLPAISITATPGNIQCYAVTETLAPGLTPFQIGQNAVWDPTNRVLKWGPYTDTQPRVLTYQVTGPSTTYPLAGQGSFDGSPAAITGATEVRVDQTTVIYVGNTNNGFGGAIGNGSLILSDDGTNLYGTLITSGPMDNALVLYIAPSPGGFSSTVGFHDAAEPLRTAISGYTDTQNNGGPGQSVLTFKSGFTPSYAIALQPGNGVNFGGLWGLANGGDNSLPFITSVNLTPVGTDVAGTYRFSLNVTNIGLTPGAGQSFKLFGTFVSDTGFRSTEAVAGDLTGVQGWNPFTQTAFATYTMIPAIFPLIVAPPADQTVPFGQSAQFASAAIGTGPLAFQWQFNGSILTDNARISGSQSSTLTIAGAQLSDVGTYLLVVTNVFGSATSAGAVLTVTETAPFLSSPHFSGAGQFAFSVGSDPNAVFDILVSTNLATWSVLSTFTNNTGNDTITLPVVNDSAAFYRLRSH